MTLVDTHCHLDSNQFSSDRDDVIRRAREAGIEFLVTIGTGDGPPDLEAGLRTAAQHDFVFTTVGIHPHDAAKAASPTFSRLRELASYQKVLWVGEIGLDYHYDFSPRNQQARVFREQIAIAREIGKPIVIHTREAWDDTFAILAEEWSPAGIPGIMHCFSGGPREAERSLELGFSLAFGGMITYPKALEIQEAAKLCPVNRLLLETDAPYLAPVPRRGKRNEPAYLIETAKRLAALRTSTLDEIAVLTTQNFSHLCSEWSRISDRREISNGY